MPKFSTMLKMNVEKINPNVGDVILLFASYT